MRAGLLLIPLLAVSSGWLVAEPTPPPPEVRIELRLKTSTPVVKKGVAASWEVWVVNRGMKAVTLVQPGDGSDCGWRTPIVEWALDGSEPKKEALLPEMKAERKPLCLTEGAPRQVRCGNINRLRKDEVFELAPGKEMKLNAWTGNPLLRTGKQKVVVRYFNLPDHPWRGMPLGEHDKGEMQRVKDSLKVVLESNAVEITVEE